MDSLLDQLVQLRGQQSEISRLVSEVFPGNDYIHKSLELAKNYSERKAEYYSSPHSSKEIQSSTVESDDEVEVVGDTKVEIPALPPVACLFRPPLEVGKVYIVKQSASPRRKWGLAKLITIFFNVHKGVTKNRCVVQYCNGCLAPTHLELHEMAYLEPWATQIPLGTAVVSNALPDNPSTCYSGIVLEVPNPLNNFRYLVFYDDGRIGYRFHKDMKVICDVYQGNTSTIDRYFIQDCLSLHPERLMLKFKIGEKIYVKKKGDWIEGSVLETDCSIIRLKFENGYTRWYYRGSYKFKTIIDDQLPKSFKSYPHLHLTKVLRNRQKIAIMDSKSIAVEQRASAEASVNAPSNLHFPLLTQRERSLTVVTPRLLFFPQDLRSHLCNENCVADADTMKRIDPQSGPLLRPLLIGFKRLIINHRIKYKTPCGRIISNLMEMYNYIILTKLALSLENFDFSPNINVKRVYSPTPGSALVSIRDLSNNLEEGGLPCVNEVDNSIPEPVTYMNKRKMLNGRDELLNSGGDFISCCSCEDNCKDSTKCECVQLTRKSYEELYEKTPLSPSEITYQYKRLFKEVRSGIYECNSKCKCNTQCPNRVVQYSLRAKLQVFNTGKKGWGVRTLFDLPKGTFVCAYIGMVLNEEEANTWGVLHGDEYLTDLDFVEKQESLKPGYEDKAPDIVEPQSEGSSRDDQESTKNSKKSFKDGNSDRRSSKRIIKTNEDVRKFFSNIKRRKTSKEVNKRSSNFPKGSLRLLYPPDYAEFTVDAKSCGNVGRYINHACDPNMFVQNVFVDTHDLRLPWVAFFTLKDIQAGSELTWDYNYLFGSVRGKRLYCYCLAPVCVGRLY